VVVVEAGAVVDVAPGALVAVLGTVVVESAGTVVVAPGPLFVTGGVEDPPRPKTRPSVTPATMTTPATITCQRYRRR
jgi:hypothetical protein